MSGNSLRSARMFKCAVRPNDQSPPQPIASESASYTRHLMGHQKRADDVLATISLAVLTLSDIL